MYLSIYLSLSPYMCIYIYIYIHMYLHSFSLTRFGAAEGRAAAPGGERGAAAEGARGFRGIVIMNSESDSDSDSNSTGATRTFYLVLRYPSMHTARYHRSWDRQSPSSDKDHGEPLV